MPEEEIDFHDRLAMALEEVMYNHDLTDDPSRVAVTHDVIIIRRNHDEPPFTEYLEAIDG